MVKKHLLLSCIFMTVTLCGQAQTETPQLASKPLASLSNGVGQLFLMTRIKKAKYSKTVPPQEQAKNSAFLYQAAVKYSREEAITESNLFRLVEHQGRHFLYDVKKGKYIGHSIQEKTYFWFEFYGEPNEYSILTQSENGMQLDGKCLCYNERTKYFGLYKQPDEKKDLFPAQLYTVTQLPSYGVTLTEDSLLPAKINKGEDAAVSLHRTFEPNALNTLILPFDVENYREVFGMQTTVYRLNEDNTQAIEFISMDNGETMKANKPYLIKGESFNSQPFIFPASTKFQYGGEEQTVKVGDITYHATYENQEFKEAADLYVVANNKIYSCKNRTIKIKPYRWYITSEKAATAKEFLLNISTGIQNTEYRETKKNTSAIYNLQGMKVADADTRNSLPHGIYICNGKKFVQ